MAEWYKDISQRSHVATYKNEKEMNSEMAKAAEFGWTVRDTTGMGGHINVGRTVTRAALTGGLGLMFGASRTKDQLTITYAREPRGWTVLVTKAGGFIIKKEIQEAVANLTGRRSMEVIGMLTSLPYPIKVGVSKEEADQVQRTLEEAGASVKLLHEGSESEANAQQSPTIDIPSQIRQLADLRETGILTDDEFEAKKLELLSRM